MKTFIAILTIILILPVTAEAKIIIRVRKTQPVKKVVKVTPTVTPTPTVKREREWEWEDVKVALAKTCRTEGIHPSVCVAQAANESMHGRSGLSVKYHNYFGMKGVGTAGTAEMWTTECSGNNCFKTRAKFAAYKHPQDSIDAYVRLVKKMLKGNTDTDPVVQLTKIWKAGYATSPKYVEHVSSVKEFEDYNY